MLIKELVGASGTKLTNLHNLNIIMGRNGSGKSRFLRSIEDGIAPRDDIYVRYISPERAGSFSRDGNVITNIGLDPNFLRGQRSVNQATNFKAASNALLSETEVLYLRKLEKDHKIRLNVERTFETDCLNRINRLLTNVELVKADSGFSFRTLDGTPIEPTKLSSGESEAVSLASEIMYFFETLKSDRINVLLLDEPDVHLHPDLQARLAHLLLDMLNDRKDLSERIAICIATHSAPFVCAIAGSPGVALGTKRFGVEEVALTEATDQLRKIAPFFGHPLSLTLSEDAALIVEGEDDERVWQQASRSSQGKIRLFPVLATTVSQQTELENFSSDLLTTLYDQPLAFSIRDGDGVQNSPLAPVGPVRRYRLNCYAIENLLVTDQCLSVMGKTWPDFQALCDQWIAGNKGHKDEMSISQLRSDVSRLRHVKIKSIRQLIVSICGSGKPWEVVVGQAIGSIKSETTAVDNMIVDFAGEDMFKNVVFRMV